MLAKLMAWGGASVEVIQVTHDAACTCSRHLRVLRCAVCCVYSLRVLSGLQLLIDAAADSSQSYTEPLPSAQAIQQKTEMAVGAAATEKQVTRLPVAG